MLFKTRKEELMATNTKDLAKTEVKTALEDIARAIDLLSSACGKLSRVEYCVDQWEKISTAHDRTKNLWHEVNQSIPWDKIDLDEDARRKLSQK